MSALAAALEALRDAASELRIAIAHLQLANRSDRAIALQLALAGISIEAAELEAEIAAGEA